VRENYFKAADPADPYNYRRPGICLRREDPNVGRHHHWRSHDSGVHPHKV